MCIRDRCAAMRAIGSLCFASDDAVQSLLKASLLESVEQILKSSKDEDLLQSVCWTVSNIAYGPAEHVQALIDSGMLSLLCGMIESPVPPIVFFALILQVKKESAWAIVNAIIKGNKEQIDKLLDTEVLSALSLMLERNDIELQVNMLDAVQKLLEAGEEVAEKFDAVGGLTALAKLQQHSNSVLANSAIKILDTFYSKD
eukprot:TRINITY_DN3976_c0_g1_i2.p1 TRINITY_DN3976_c0_g1~~TRINITY_DN3976_c0_g1_i2.p1  ORF type:complete len:200 (+),score=35.67 TRINITY_DN3976_c0_g1_i2:81-680(+)